MNSETKQRINRILLWILIVITAVWMLFPFYWAVNSSFKTENQLQMMPATFIPRDAAGAMNFTRAAQCAWPGVAPSIWNTPITAK